MGSDCAAKKVARHDAGPKGTNVSTAPQEPNVSKLLAMADNVVVRGQVYKRARHSTNTELEAREYGRLNKSIHELAETAEKCRKTGAGKASQP